MDQTYTFSQPLARFFNIKTRFLVEKIFKSRITPRLPTKVHAYSPWCKCIAYLASVNNFTHYVYLVQRLYKHGYLCLLKCLFLLSTSRSLNVVLTCIIYQNLTFDKCANIPLGQTLLCNTYTHVFNTTLQWPVLSNSMEIAQRSKRIVALYVNYLEQRNEEGCITHSWY